MKYAVRKIPAAELDTAEAAGWHEQQQPGLGLRFLNDVDAAVEFITRNQEVPAITRSSTFRSA